MKNSKLFKKQMLLVGEKYQIEISQLMAKMVWEGLKPFDDLECEEAFRHVIYRGRFFKDLLPDLLEYLELDSSSNAWNELLHETMRYIPGMKVKLNKKIFRIVKNLGGWQRFVLMSTKELPWIRKEFETQYKSVFLTPMIPEGTNKSGVKKLRGISDRATKIL